MRCWVNYISVRRAAHHSHKQAWQVAPGRALSGDSQMNPPRDTPDSASAHPVLTVDETKRLEAQLFGGDETREWPAMRRAGRAIGEAVLRDFCEMGKIPDSARILVLAGKGHNGGDALIAARHILEKHPRACVRVHFVFGARALRPLAMRAWRELAQASPGRADILRALPENDGWDLCIDGIFGFQFRPPVDARVAALIARANALPVRFRAAVDLPSGGLFRADFTYATGAVKTPALDDGNCGRLRYLDLGFFENRARAACADSVLTPAILSPLRGLRAPRTDKRDFGHLFVVGGSREYPGAILMSVLAALRSGAGLVTAFVPESLVPAFAAQAPEAIWRGMAESPAGGLGLDGFIMLAERLVAEKSSTARPTALLIGPGLSRDREALVLAAETLRAVRDVPVVLDADALQPETICEGVAPRILTPHAGELRRIATAIPKGAVMVRKGPLTRIGREGEAAAYVSPFGGPVLARGGSGDVLAGMIGGLLAQAPDEPLLAACRGAVWHGLAADCLARAQGQQAVRTTQLLDCLPGALQGENT